MPRFRDCSNNNYYLYIVVHDFCVVRRLHSVATEWADVELIINYKADRLGMSLKRGRYSRGILHETATILFPILCNGYNSPSLSLSLCACVFLREIWALLACLPSQTGSASRLHWKSKPYQFQTGPTWSFVIKNKARILGLFLLELAGRRSRRLSRFLSASLTFSSLIWSDDDSWKLSRNIIDRPH